MTLDGAAGREDGGDLWPFRFALLLKSWRYKSLKPERFLKPHTSLIERAPFSIWWWREYTTNPKHHKSEQKVVWILLLAVCIRFTQPFDQTLLDRHVCLTGKFVPLRKEIERCVCQFFCTSALSSAKTQREQRFERRGRSTFRDTVPTIYRVERKKSS